MSTEVMHSTSDITSVDIVDLMLGDLAWVNAVIEQRRVEFSWSLASIQ